MRVPAQLVVTALVLAFALLHPAGAVAQTAPAGRQVLNETADGYRIAVYVQPEDPVIGTVHFNIVITNEETADPVTDAVVRLYGSPAPGSQPGGARQTALALTTPAQPGTYTGNLELEHPGRWAIDVALLEPEERVISSFPLDVRGGQRSSSYRTLGTAMFLLVSAAFAGGAVWLWLQSRRAGSKAAASR